MSSDQADVHQGEWGSFNLEDQRNSFANETANRTSFSSATSEKSQRVADTFEPIDIEGQKETGIWVHHPGSDVSQTWEPKKGKSRCLDTPILGELNGASTKISTLEASGSQNSSSSTDESPDDKHRMGRVRRGLRKISSIFHRSPKEEDQSSSFRESIQSPHVNIKAVNEKDIGVKLVVEKDVALPALDKILKEEDSSSGESGPESPSKGNMKDKAKSFFRNAGKSARSFKVLSRKDSKSYPADSPVVTNRGDLADYDSSDDESLPSKNVETIRVVSDVVVHDSGNDSSSSQDHVVQTGEIDKPIDASMEKVSPKGLEMLHDRVGSPDSKPDVESLKLKLDEGDLDGQTK